MQHGGSSTELYPHFFESEQEANDYINECWDDGAYQCDGPFEVPVTGDCDIIAAFHELLERHIPDSKIVDTGAWNRLVDRSKKK